jgi:hypothetical protein
MQSWTGSSAAVVVMAAAILGLGGASPASGADPDVTLRVISAAGEPGDEIAFEFRADARLPIADASVQFDLSKAAAEILRTSVEGTAAAHVIPRGIIFDPRFFRGGYRAGVRLIAGTQRSVIEPGIDIILFKVVFRVTADAVPGEYPLNVTGTDFSAGAAGVVSVSVQVEGSASLTVRPPSRPRPVRSLRCVQQREQVVLTWSNSAAYDSIAILRNGTEVAAVTGSAEQHADTPPPGPTSYAVVARRDGQSAAPIPCSVLVDIPRPNPITGFTCQSGDGRTSLGWTNGERYDQIELFRNGGLLGQLAGDATSFEDAWTSDLFTVYTLRAAQAGVSTLPVSCSLNALSDRYLIWAEDVRATPGARGVPIRLFITNPQILQSIQVGLRIDPALARIRELSVAGTISEAAEYDWFAYQQFYVPGETAAGLQFDTIPPFGFKFPAGADQHFLTVIVDVPESTPGGTEVALDLGVFGKPALGASLTVGGAALTPDTADGAVLVGDSPVPEVEAARAVVPGAPAEPGQGGGGAQAGSVTLTWSNRDAYSSLKIERSGVLLEEIPGDRISYVDLAPGAGIHHYSITARRGAAASFPVVVTTLPQGVPGTFLRGDTDGDTRVSVTDAVGAIAFLIRGGPIPRCLDAADADDNGRVNIADPIAILQMLFLGAGPLPAPGPTVAWFDPTADELSCE